MRFLPVVLCIALTLSGVANAGRIASSDVTPHRLEAELRQHFNLLADEPVYFIVRYDVSPSQKNSFVQAWEALESASSGEQGLQILTIKKAADDNSYFLEYEEWASGKELYNHLASKHYRQFQDFLDSNYVSWKLEPLEKVEDQQDLRPGGSTEQRRAAYTQPGGFHLLTSFRFTEASTKHEFKGAWHDAATATVQEQGTLVFSLHKSKTKSNQFYEYGIWTSLADLLVHYESDHMKQLRLYMDEKDIRWSNRPFQDIQGA
jgi:quinol monooxygenase YgiN